MFRCVCQMPWEEEFGGDPRTQFLEVNMQDSTVRSLSTCLSELL